MGLEAATYIESLTTTNPVSSDPVAQGDDHLRLLKSTLKNTFPGLTREIYLEKNRADLASSATPNLGGTTSNYINITGITEIDSFSGGVAGMVKLLRFNAALVLDFDAVNFSNITGGNITTAAGDHAWVVCISPNVWRIVMYQKFSGASLIPPAYNVDDAVITAPTKADLIPLQDATDGNLPKRALAQHIAELARTTVSLMVFDILTVCSVGDVAGRVFWCVPAWMNGMNLVDVSGVTGSVGSGSSMLVQVRNAGQGADMLSSRLTFASGAQFSSTATIDTGNDDIATSNVIVIDIDQVHSSPPTGLVINLTFERPI